MLTVPSECIVTISEVFGVTSTTFLLLIVAAAMSKVFKAATGINHDD